MNRRRLSESCRRVGGACADQMETRSPRIARDLGGLWWLRGLDLNQRPLGYELA